jgi:dienelactone hydrolase
MQNDTCCPTDATANDSRDYVPRGVTVRITDNKPDTPFDVYVLGPTTGITRAVVVCTDIFGLIPISLRFLDDLHVESGLTVVCVDHFRGNPIRMADFPPPPGTNIREKIQALAPTDLLLRDIDAVLNWLGPSVTSVGHLGFCFGGHLSIALAKQGRVKCAASAHPSFITAADISACAAVPVCLLPSMGEDVTIYADIERVLKQNGPHNVYKRYDTMPHGWCAARAVYSDPEPINDARKVIGSFFLANL